MTTTNGTRALRACAHANRVLISSILNLSATRNFILNHADGEILLVCSGTFEQAACEDALAAGWLCNLLWESCAAGGIADSALMARKLYLGVAGGLEKALGETRNGKRLLSFSALKADVAFCAQLDKYPLIAAMDPGGCIRRLE